MTIPDWFFQLIIITVLGIFGFIAKRYLDIQDKKYQLLIDDFKEYSEKFTTAIEGLRDVIGGLRSTTAIQKTICEQKHKHLDDTLAEIKKKIEHL